MGSFWPEKLPGFQASQGQEWGGLEGWKGGGCEEFLDRMFLRRLSPHSAPDPSPQPGLGHLPLPPMALALPFPSSTTAAHRDIFSQPTLPAGHQHVILHEPLGIIPAPQPLGPTQLGVGMHARRGRACLFLEKKLEERMCSFPYPPCGSQPLTFRKFSLLSDLSVSYCRPLPPLPMAVLAVH